MCIRDSKHAIACRPSSLRLIAAGVDSQMGIATTIRVIVSLPGGAPPPGHPPRSASGAPAG
eukprot:2679217-Alexandrium_andersonii.AAC.1